MAMSKDDQIVEILTQILRVQAIQMAATRSSVTDGARMLKLAGLDNQTIADVLNTSPAVIRTLTSNLRAAVKLSAKKKGRKGK